MTHLEGRVLKGAGDFHDRRGEEAEEGSDARLRQRQHGAGGRAVAGRRHGHRRDAVCGGVGEEGVQRQPRQQRIRIRIRIRIHIHIHISANAVARPPRGARTGARPCDRLVVLCQRRLDRAALRRGLGVGPHSRASVVHAEQRRQALDAGLHQVVGGGPQRPAVPHQPQHAPRHRLHERCLAREAPREQRAQAAGGEGDDVGGPGQAQTLPEQRHERRGHCADGGVGAVQAAAPQGRVKEAEAEAHRGHGRGAEGLVGCLGPVCLQLAVTPGEFGCVGAVQYLCGGNVG